ncbi:hypothetical protein KQ941_18455 [Paenibacillus xylanexedens]|uniref:hypothetical protein n=1 Tax=Paenibacillus xylanexedens TaxID=528191 RepID=UPI001F32B929|nr:hypothetical protein [Paenibacillus xylanexedens]MCF7756427.1 hypothetical protein [Paenibacillus xylanexedens]
MPTIGTIVVVNSFYTNPAMGHFYLFSVGVALHSYALVHVMYMSSGLQKDSGGWDDL